MSFIEFETWTIKKGVKEEHDQMIRDWFQFVRSHHKELFSEWKSAKYYRYVDKEGHATGKYLMLFEFFSRENLLSYKERRKNWDGPYEEYREYDPYQFFNVDEVTTEHWEPLEVDLWLDFSRDDEPSVDFSDYSSQITFLYFDDFIAANDFFSKILDLKCVMDAGWAKVYKTSGSAFVGAVQKGKGSLHDTGTQRVLISLTTHDAIAARERMIRKTPVSEIKEFEDIGLRSFFIEGPEGYSFEIQQFLNDKEKFLF